jgi:hypothetical protein
MHTGFNFKRINLGVRSETSFWPSVQTLTDFMCVFKCEKVHSMTYICVHYLSFRSRVELLLYK